MGINDSVLFLAEEKGGQGLLPLNIRNAPFFVESNIFIMEAFGRVFFGEVGNLKFIFVQL